MKLNVQRLPQTIAWGPSYQMPESLEQFNTQNDGTSDTKE